ncbi:substrate-binding domain-containing protein [Streptomyces sp. NBC_00145]|uniref:substrate-binding domain-containing protein n=1 Tax=Streptomyces sp. NBC_00145 TaxID=2975666 RepID=UPI003FA68F3F
MRRLRGAGVPFIQFSRRIPDLRADFVGVDDFAVASDILRHVVEDHGNTDVAVITGPPNSSASSTRAVSFVRTAQAIGLTLPPYRRFNAYLAAEGGHTVVQRLMARNDLPRAIVCGSDAIASGVIGALRSQGLRVPEDVAVTGVDGVFPAASMLAELTTISVPRRRIAELSVEQLIKRVDGVRQAPPRTAEFDGCERRHRCQEEGNPHHESVPLPATATQAGSARAAATPDQLHPQACAKGASSKDVATGKREEARILGLQPEGQVNERVAVALLPRAKVHANVCADGRVTPSGSREAMP